MDNFKRRAGKDRHSSSLDGIFEGGSLSPGRRQLHDRSRNRLDNFKRPEGFRSGQSKSIMQKSDRLGEAGHPGSKDSLGLEPRQSRKTRKHAHHSSRLRRFTKKAANLAVILVVVSAGYLFGKAYLRTLQIFAGGGGAAALEENVDPSKLRGEGDGRVNILLLGKGGAGHEAPDLTDTIVIASIDPINKEAALLSIPRDFYVPTSTNNKINAVYADAKQRAISEGKTGDDAENIGLEAIETQLETVLGIPIHYHAMIDFEGFRKAINTVGGITVNVPKDLEVYEYYAESNYTLNVKAGPQSFDGERALAFSRSRKTSRRGDFDRAGRQRLVLVALKDKVISLGTFGNPLKISQLLDDFGKHIRTNLTVGEMLRVYEIGNEIPSDKIESLSLVDEPNVLLAGANIGGSVQVPKAGNTNYKDIQSFVRNRLKDSFLRDENAVVSVLNGTSINGLASRTADELKSYGYNISEVANSPIKDQQSTIIVDMTSGSKKYTKAYLEKRFGVSATNALPDSRIEPGSADFVIILGQNEQARLGQ